MLTNQLNRKISFRPDIEGLRGLAVILVMLLHFNLPYVTGGYIGVDIFFVLSGYLITQMIVQKVVKGQFTFKDFYTRRIRRLVPALLLVSIVAVIGFSLFLLPGDLISFLKSARDVFLFKSNVFFAKEAGDYFGAEAETMPLLHTWSLAVEWQFYFLFPIFLYAVLKYIKKPVYALMGLFVGCLIFSIYASVNLESAYYMSSTRAFEFLAGALAAFIRFNLKKQLATLLTGLALFILIALALIYDANTIYPGVNALWVALATFAVLLFGEHSKLLTSNLMIHIGKLSYSAYLWHWPLIVGVVYFGYELKTVYVLPLILVVFLLSQFTYSFIENPIRRSKLSFKNSMIYFVVAPIVVMVTICAVVKQYEGFPQRLGAEQAKAFLLIKQHYDPMRLACNHEKINLAACSFGELQNPKKEILLLGDSHAAHLKRFIELFAKDANYKAYLQSKSACLMLKGDYEPPYQHKKKACDHKIREIYQLIGEKKLDYVILSHRWHAYIDTDNDIATYKQALSETVAFISKTGATPVVVLPVAEREGQNLNTCFYRNIKDPTVCDIATEDLNHHYSNINKMFAEIKREHSELVLINLQDIQCLNGVCSTYYDGVPIYEDKTHINAYSAKLLSEKYMGKYGNPLLDKVEPYLG